jgi:acyl-CoA:acyl-CoA alkyltransferase
MNFENVVIAGVEAYLPETILTSDEIESQLSVLYTGLKLPEGRLELMTGIKERRVWPNGTRPSSLSIKAAENLFQRYPQLNHVRSEIDLLIHSSVCRDFLEPSTASVVHAGLNLSPHAMIFDLSNACLGMVNSMVVAAHMIERGQIKYALIVSGENGGPLLKETIRSLNEKFSRGEINRKTIKKYFANLTIGSAATAILLSHKDLFPHAPKVLGGVVQTDSSANVLCSGDGNPHQLMMETDSEQLMVKGVALAKTNWELAKKNLHWNEEDIDWVLTHQVGKAHEELTLQSLNLSHKKSHRTYPFLGNTGSSALPVTLHSLIRENLMQPGEKLALMGIGSGLTSIILGVEWGEL